MSNDQLNLFTSEFEVLISESKREDDWVNVTKWCKYYGKRWSEYKRLPQTKNLFKALQDKLSAHSGKIPLYEISGKPKQTFVHPLVAVDLAGWLNVDFRLFVLEVFKGYIEADINVADNVIQRNNNQQDLDWLQARLEGKQARKAFTDELKKRGVKGIGYAQNTNAVYNGLFDKPAKELKEDRKSSSLRDSMSDFELAAVRLAELGAKKRFEGANAFGNNQTVHHTKDVSQRIRQALDGI